MLRVSVLRQAASAAVSMPPASPEKPLKVVVLTMIPNGGAMAEALRILGYNPYTLETSVRKGRVLTHPQEWMSVLRRDKPFSFEILRIPEEAESKKTRIGAKTTYNQGGVSVSAASPSSPPRYYDALVGPPATTAFEAVLKECPRSTRVILVEEPDKLAWEKDMDQLLRPLAARCEQSTRFWQDSRLHTMLLDMVDLRRALIDPADARRGRRARCMPTSAAAMAAQNVPLAQQQATLRLSGALDLFEQHVREVVPSERLLVFRVADGWQPLCDFLQLPVPTSSTSPSSSSSAGADSRAVAAPCETLPFPVNSNGGDVLLFLDQGMQKTNMVVAFIVLSAAALGLLVLASFRDELSSFYTDYYNYMRADFEPYLEEQKREKEAGQEPTLTTHKALILAKRSTQRFGEAYEKEGGAASSMSGVLRRFTGTQAAGKAAEGADAPPAESGEKQK